MNSIIRVRYAALLVLLFAGVMALGACSKPNPLLGSWTFQAYKGGGQLGSVLGGLASQFNQGTVVTFKQDAMIVAQGGTQHKTAVDHYEVKGDKVTVWLRTASDLMEGRTYLISGDGQSMSRELGGGVREVFARAKRI
ncbi:MAG: hypothetical protein P8Y78_09345 [Acidihalobacter sp.]